MHHSPEHPTETHFVVRPFQNADAVAVAKLVTDSVRGQWTYLPERFRESPEPTRQRLVAEHGGEVVASAHLSPFAPGTPEALRLDLAGDGAAFTPLYLHLLTRLPAGFTRLLGVTREDFAEQMDFFQAAGFRNAWQSWGAHLKLSAFEFEHFRPLEERLFLQGYEAEHFPNDSADTDWDDLYRLYMTGVQDAPRNPTTTPDPLTRDTLKATIKHEETAFVVRRQGELVAFTRLTPRGHEVESEFTVTHAAHRSRGLGTLVKARALAWAQEQGFGQAGTGGTVLNLYGLRLNPAECGMKSDQREKEKNAFRAWSGQPGVLPGCTRNRRNAYCPCCA